MSSDLQVRCVHCDEWSQDFCAGCGKALCPQHAFEEVSALGPQWVCLTCSGDDAVAPYDPAVHGD